MKTKLLEALQGSSQGKENISAMPGSPEPKSGGAPESKETQATGIWGGMLGEAGRLFNVAAQAVADAANAGAEMIGGPIDSGSAAVNSAKKVLERSGEVVTIETQVKVVKCFLDQGVTRKENSAYEAFKNVLIVLGAKEDKVENLIEQLRLLNDKDGSLIYENKSLLNDNLGVMIKASDRAEDIGKALIWLAGNPKFEKVKIFDAGKPTFIGKFILLMQKNNLLTTENLNKLLSIPNLKAINLSEIQSGNLERSKAQELFDSEIDRVEKLEKGVEQLLIKGNGLREEYKKILGITDGEEFVQKTQEWMMRHDKLLREAKQLTGTYKEKFDEKRSALAEMRSHLNTEMEFQKVLTTGESLREEYDLILGITNGGEFVQKVQEWVMRHDKLLREVDQLTEKHKEKFDEQRLGLFEMRNHLNVEMKFQKLLLELESLHELTSNYEIAELSSFLVDDIARFAVIRDEFINGEDFSLFAHLNESRAKEIESEIAVKINELQMKALSSEEKQDQQKLDEMIASAEKKVGERNKIRKDTDDGELNEKRMQFRKEARKDLSLLRKIRADTEKAAKIEAELGEIRIDMTTILNATESEYIHDAMEKMQGAFNEVAGLLSSGFRTSYQIIIYSQIENMFRVPSVNAISSDDQEEMDNIRRNYLQAFKKGLINRIVSLKERHEVEVRQASAQALLAQSTLAVDEGEAVVVEEFHGLETSGALGEGADLGKAPSGKKAKKGVSRGEAVAPGSSKTETTEQDQKVLVALYAGKGFMHEEMASKELAALKNSGREVTLEMLVKDYLKDDGILDKKVKDLQMDAAEINKKKRVPFKRDSVREWHRDEFNKVYKSVMELMKNLENVSSHLSNEQKSKLEQQKSTIEGLKLKLEEKPVKSPLQTVKKIFKRASGVGKTEKVAQQQEKSGAEKVSKKKFDIPIFRSKKSKEQAETHPQVTAKSVFQRLGKRKREEMQSSEGNEPKRRKLFTRSQKKSEGNAERANKSEGPKSGK